MSDVYSAVQADIECHPMLAPDEAACLGCGYSLRGLSSRKCPEWGRAFDPSNSWTMRLPRTPYGWAKRAMEPTLWPFRRIRATLIVILGCSAWFPPPSPLPTLFVLAYWMRWAWPAYKRLWVRRMVARRHMLEPSVSRIDATGISRLRRMFWIALLLVASQLPFIISYAISRPFFVRTARYWMDVAPINEQPRPGPALCGVMPVMHREATLRTVRFHLPGGTVEMGHGEDGRSVWSSFQPYLVNEDVVRSIGNFFDP